MGGRTRAQAGVIEFLVLILVMLFITYESLMLAGKSKAAGILLLERSTIQRSAERIESAVRELDFTGYGRETIALPQRPFITYFIPVAKGGKGGVILGASFEDISFTTELDLHDARFLCPPGTYSNLTVVVENWGNGTQVRC